ncbi:FAD dependent oxidoreductase [Rhodococcus sp. AW25M09]|uniref:NAD(P)/FAD-dependent oxidoreductase n=1 Tax=Rhodococcus sp. AW25M09 TaxID=1268303 RepID=UPI0002ACC809|nr:FAD-binding oxidoreductase [Rhodococcus sp. AW25M09]CCQ16339.1 FAD dependent oxidoreductase [Rhodococcus sp. AW25M09]
MRTEVDVVVIGAGIVGAATALALTRAGSRVAVLDRSVPNTAGSGTTAGNLHIQTIHTRRPGQGTAVDVEQLLPLQKSTSTLWNTLAETVPGLGLNRCGGFMVAETDEQVAALVTKAGWEKAAGIPTEVLGGDEARRALPLLGPTIESATWCAWDGFAEPDLAGPAMLRQAVAEGATVHPSTPVTGLTRNGDMWNVRAGEENWIAPAVIDVAGPWMAPIAALAGVSLDLVPTALQMHSLKAAPRTLEVLVQHVGEGMSIKQDRTGRLVLGGGWPAGKFHETDAASTRLDSTDGNLAQVRRILPALGRNQLLDTWTGPVVTTPDEMPVIGELDAAPGLFVAGGTYSFTFAPLWGHVLTELVHGRETELDISAFSPDRLVHLTTH